MGPVATVLVQEGTLKVGDPFVCGGNYGRVRAMIDDKGRKVDVAGPSTPVEILGLQGVPEAGSSFVVVTDEATARQVAEHRRGKQREATLVKTAKVSLEDLYQQIQAGDVKELRVVIKADVQGSVEALSEALSRLSTDEVRLNVLHASVGGITESDVLLASASNAVVIGFNVRPESKATEVADREGVDVRLYTVIYDALNDVRDAMEGLLEPTVREKTVGRAEVRQVFNIPSFGVDRRIVRARRQDHAQRRGPPGARSRRRAHRQDRQPAAVQGRRPRGAVRLRVRHRTGELPGHQGRRRDRGVRNRAGGAAADAVGR